MVVDIIVIMVIVNGIVMVIAIGAYTIVIVKYTGKYCSYYCIYSFIIKNYHRDLPLKISGNTRKLVKYLEKNLSRF